MSTEETKAAAQAIADLSEYRDMLLAQAEEVDAAIHRITVQVAIKEMEAKNA